MDHKVKSITLDIPWPPSVNHYYGRNAVGGGFKKPEVVAFFAAVRDIVKANDAARFCYEMKRIGMQLTMFPPDNIRRDLDNLKKGIQDAFQKAEMYPDDSRIECSMDVRGNTFKKKVGDVTISGRVRVKLFEYQEPRPECVDEVHGDELQIHVKFEQAKARELDKRKKREAAKKLKKGGVK
jgi:crossover junction endodeoxyribonuclease RusA